MWPGINTSILQPGPRSKEAEIFLNGTPSTDSKTDIPPTDRPTDRPPARSKPPIQNATQSAMDAGQHPPAEMAKPDLPHWPAEKAAVAAAGEEPEPCPIGIGPRSVRSRLDDGPPPDEPAPAAAPNAHNGQATPPTHAATVAEHRSGESIGRELHLSARGCARADRQRGLARCLRSAVPERKPPARLAERGEERLVQVSGMRTSCEERMLSLAELRRAAGLGRVSHKACFEALREGGVGPVRPRWGVMPRWGVEEEEGEVKGQGGGGEGGCRDGGLKGE